MCPGQCSEAVGQKCYVRQRRTVLVQGDGRMQRGCAVTAIMQCSTEIPYDARCSVVVACHLLAQHSGALPGAMPKF